MAFRKKNSQMTELYPALSEMILNINNLNSLIKNRDWQNVLKSVIQLYAIYKKLNIQRQNKSRLSICLYVCKYEKIDFETKILTRNKEGNFTMIKG